jgi:hypothetical protein
MQWALDDRSAEKGADELSAEQDEYEEIGFYLNGTQLDAWSVLERRYHIFQGPNRGINDCVAAKAPRRFEATFDNIYCLLRNVEGLPLLDSVRLICRKIRL